jgi:hypothetical protein
VKLRLWVIGAALSCGCVPALSRDGPAEAERASRSLSALFPDWSPGCAACLQGNCSEQLRGCVDDAACAGFVECRWGANPGPDKELSCALEYGSSNLEESITRDLSSCWDTRCVDACQLGTNWACAGNYTLPPPGDGVTITQTLQHTDRSPVSGASVRFCGAAATTAECDETDAVVTDDQGICRAEVAAGAGDRAGWWGYRQVAHPDLFPARLETSLRVPQSRSMLQQVPRRSEVPFLAVTQGADLQLGNIIFQVFDCAHNGADGATVEVTELAGTEGGAPASALGIGYVEDQNAAFPSFAQDATHARGAGGGVVLNLKPHDPVLITVRRPCLEGCPDGSAEAEIASIPVFTNPNELLLLEIHPSP